MKGRGRNGRAPIIWSAGRAPASSGPAGKDAPMPGRQTRMAQHHISARKGSGLRAAARSAPSANPRFGSFRLAKLQT
ncbi:hypothetical protein DESPIG_02165 [Desulfovibrio piger ATCC 29098]|uniref:Uncharacterized protein n=1 Tax=Desulfovibrio piger ATCC 29098 TaxID=411464 RepID=B6WVP7_9BACT|nr:hypothetical protein DESPIG_02165 [Desulfovibrio piger ATCC 29098]